MNELKIYHCEEWHNPYTEFYLKSEADKEIKNKDYEIKELKKSIGKLLKTDIEQVMNEVIQNTLIYGNSFVPVEHAMRLVSELRHHKYKRCLAMAKLCQWKMGVFIYKKEKSNFYHRWHKRWIAIAEKFKPNTTRQQKD